MESMNSLRELFGVSFMVQIGLAAVYGYVYLLYRRPAFLWYSIGWASAAGFAIFQSVYTPDPQMNLLLNIEQQCVLGVCLLLGLTYLGAHSSSNIAIVRFGALAVGAVSLVLLGWRVEASVMVHITNALVVGVAAVMTVTAMRFLSLRYDDLLNVLRPEPPPLSVPTFAVESEGATESRLVPAWRELRLARRLMVVTFAVLALLQLAWFGVRHLEGFYLPALFLTSMVTKAAQAIAVGLWVLADMRTTNDRLLVRSVAEELGVLTASIEHDVRNPLSILKKDIEPLV
jgi:signal transduction histidine kinase